MIYSRNNNVFIILDLVYGTHYRVSFKICKITCMRSEMTLKQPRPGKGFATIIAFAVLIMGSHVHGEGRHAHVDFCAVWTFLCLGVIQ